MTYFIYQTVSVSFLCDLKPMLLLYDKILFLVKAFLDVYE